MTVNLKCHSCGNELIANDNQSVIDSRLCSDCYEVFEIA